MDKEEKSTSAYEEATRGKTEEEILAIDYFTNKQKKKGCLKKKNVPLVTDAQFDELVSRRASEVTSSSVLAAMGITTPPVWVIDPLKVCTPEFEGAEYVRMGNDEKARTSRFTTTFLLYAKDVMYLYSRTVSLTDRYSNEIAASIMYRDITSVELDTVTTETRHDVIESGGCMRKSKQVPVWIPSTYNTAVFTVPGKTYSVNVGGAKTVMTNAIAALRAKISECKK